MPSPLPPILARLAPAVAACALTLPAHADDRAARALDAVRAAYRTNPIDELITIEVRGQGTLADTSEGRLRLQLSPPGPPDVPPALQTSPAPHDPAEPDAAARPLLDLTVGPVRTLATATGITVLHATDPERYVGRAIDALTLEDLERVIPSIPLPQVALAIGDSTGHTLHIPSILPPLTLHEIARGQTTITLTGRDGPVAATLVIARDTHRVQRFEATVPAASGWYDLIITAQPLPAPHVEAPQAPTPLAHPDLTGRHRVTRVADLRPRGLVLVPNADLNWLPVHPAESPGPAAEPPASGDATTLGALLHDRGPMAVAFLALPASGADGPSPLDPAWVDEARQIAQLLDAARGQGWSLLLLFDPSARRSISAARVDAALSAAGIDTPWAWVDGRTVALDRALPRIDPALAAVSRQGTILDIGKIPADAASRADFTTRLHDALVASP